MLFHACGQFAFDDVLQAGIQGQDHVQTVARFDVLIPVGNQFALVFVHFRFPPAGNAAEVGVEGQFHAAQAGLLLVAGDEAKTCAARRWLG